MARTTTFTGVLMALGMGLAGAVWAQAAGPDQLQETYRDWTVRCDTLQGAAGTAPVRTCELAQEVTQADTGQRVVSIGVLAVGDGTAELTLIAPFGLDLAGGITLLTDGTQTASLPFRTCLPLGCVATAPLDAPGLAQLAAGTALEVRMAAEGGAPVSVSLSLAGFGDGWARLAALAAD